MTETARGYEHDFNDCFRPGLDPDPYIRIATFVQTLIDRGEPCKGQFVVMGSQGEVMILSKGTYDDLIGGTETKWVAYVNPEEQILIPLRVPG